MAHCSHLSGPEGSLQPVLSLTVCHMLLFFKGVLAYAIPCSVHWRHQIVIGRAFLENARSVSVDGNHDNLQRGSVQAQYRLFCQWDIVQES